MNSWNEVEDGHWRKEATLPIGRATADIHQRGGFPLYDTRVELSFYGDRLPEAMAKTSLALPSLRAAETSCNRLLAELVVGSILSR